MLKRRLICLGAKGSGASSTTGGGRPHAARGFEKTSAFSLGRARATSKQPQPRTHTHTSKQTRPQAVPPARRRKKQHVVGERNEKAKGRGA